jgi:molybdopterin molybdotransferase
MISVDDALKIILANVPAPRVEEVYFESALGLVLAETIRANRDVPPFRRASMDGYALRSADVTTTPVVLKCVGEIRAGADSSVHIQAGEAVAIMTGSAVPEGADAVQMVELTNISANRGTVQIQKSVKPGENVTPQGHEARAGEIALEAGRAVGPAELAVFATFGYNCVRVYARPRVALLATGDELVEVAEIPGPSQIRNSNAYSLSGQLRQMGINPDYLGIARDEKEDLRLRIEEGMKRDVLILTGGASLGEYDFVEEVFKELGLEVLFNKVAMKPGKPTIFARRKDTLVFGLPGNPISTFISFENFVRPALGRICGFGKPELIRVRGKLLKDMKQKPGRTAFLPAWAIWEGAGWTIEPLVWKGSADIIGFSRSNAAVIFPGERDRLRSGEEVEAMLLPDYHLRSGGRGPIDD